MTPGQQVLEFQTAPCHAGNGKPSVPSAGSKPLFVLDLFFGLEGWSVPWRARGHEIFRVELDDKFPAEHRDVMDFDPWRLPRRPDVVLASPPCTAFSVMQIGRNWTHDHQPKNDRARAGLILLERTLWIIAQIDPEIFIIENPVGKMRRMPQLRDFERRNVTYCQYGERRMKPTDLWGGVPTRIAVESRLQKWRTVSRSCAARLTDWHTGNGFRPVRENTRRIIPCRVRRHRTFLCG